MNKMNDVFLKESEREVGEKNQDSEEETLVTDVVFVVSSEKRVERGGKRMQYAEELRKKKLLPTRSNF